MRRLGASVPRAFGRAERSGTPLGRDHAVAKRVRAPLPGADPLWANTSQYSSLMWPSAEPDTFFVCYERGGDYNPDGSVPAGGRVGDAVLHLTQLRLPAW